MKRCPECDFLYYDDQRLCDMDGTALVHDSHVFPDSHPAIHRVAGDVQRMAIALPLTVLSVLGFYVLKHQSPTPVSQVMPAIESVSTQGTNGTAASITSAPTSESAPAASTTTGGKEGSGIEAGNVPAQSPGVNPPENSATNESPADSEAPAAKPARKPIRSQNRKVSAANDTEKDSKVSSFLKKTGRLLKKPFKL